MGVDDLQGTWILCRSAKYVQSGVASTLPFRNVPLSSRVSLSLKCKQSSTHGCEHGHTFRLVGNMAFVWESIRLCPWNGWTQIGCPHVLLFEIPAWRLGVTPCILDRVLGFSVYDLPRFARFSSIFAFGHRSIHTGQLHMESI